VGAVLQAWPWPGPVKVPRDYRAAVPGSMAASHVQPLLAHAEVSVLERGRAAPRVML